MAEQDDAALSQQRGKLAVTLPAGSKQQRDYIAAQGEAESGGGSRWLPKVWAGQAAKGRIKSATDVDQIKGLAGIGKT